jgi:hypothetical protein
VTLSTIVVKQGNGTTATYLTSLDGSGNNVATQNIVGGTNNANIALVSAAGAVVVDATATTQPVQTTAPGVLVAGSSPDWGNVGSVVAWNGSGTPNALNLLNGIYNAAASAAYVNGGTYASFSATGGFGASTEPTKVTTGTAVHGLFDLVGKTITSPYANRENYVRGTATSTDTGAHSVIASAGGSLKNYITGIQLGRTDAGTTAITVTFNDSASTVVVLPGLTGGATTNFSFHVPLATAAATAFTFTCSSGVTTAYCSAQGYTGY